MHLYPRGMALGSALTTVHDPEQQKQMQAEQNVEKLYILALDLGEGQAHLSSQQAVTKWHRHAAHHMCFKLDFHLRL